MSARTDILHSLNRLWTEGSLAGHNDLALLQRFVATRDETAFEILVRRHGPTVLAACRAWLSRSEDLDDAFQATFLVLVQRAGSLRRPDRIGPWLYGVATRVAARVAHRRKQRQAREASVPSLADIPGSGAAPSADLDLDLRPILHEELTRLREPDRQAVILCYLEGLTHEQAAERLQWPLGTVKGRLARARETLRSRLVRRGVVASSAVIAAWLATPHTRAAVSDRLLHLTLEAVLTRLCPVSTLAATSPVALLAQGVSSTMLWHSSSQVAAVLGLAGILTTGALVASTQPNTTQEHAPEARPAASAVPAPAAPAAMLPPGTGSPDQAAAAPAPQPEPPAPANPDDQVALARRRLNLAHRLYQLARARHEQGESDLAPVYAAARRLADATLDPALLSTLSLNQARDLQIEVITGQLNHARALWEDAKVRVRAGLIATNTELEAELEVADLELKLARLKAQPAPTTTPRTALAPTPLLPTPDAIVPVGDATVAELPPPAGTPVAPAAAPTPAPAPHDLQPERAPVAPSDLPPRGHPTLAHLPEAAPLPSADVAEKPEAMRPMPSPEHHQDIALSPGAPTSPAILPRSEHARGGGGGHLLDEAQFIDTDPEQTEAISDALDTKISTPFQVETPLEDVLKYIQRATEGKKLPKGIPIYLDLPSLKELGITPQSPISLDLDGVKLRTTLRLMLRQLGLTYTVSDGVLVIHAVTDEAYQIHKPLPKPDE